MIDSTKEQIVWHKQIKNYEMYQIFDNCMIWSRYKNKWLKVRVDDGYYRVSLYNEAKKKTETKSIHLLMYQNFVGAIPKGYQVHHKDFNPLNNSLSNLLLLTKEQHHQLHVESEITKKKISNTMKGKKKPPRSEQWRKKKSEAMKKAIQSGKYTPPSFKGHKHSQQSKYLMSQAHKK